MAIWHPRRATWHPCSSFHLRRVILASTSQQFHPWGAVFLFVHQQQFSSTKGNLASTSRCFHPRRATWHPCSSFHLRRAILASTSSSFHPRRATWHPCSSFHLRRAILASTSQQFPSIMDSVLVRPPPPVFIHEGQFSIHAAVFCLSRSSNFHPRRTISHPRSSFHLQRAIWQPQGQQLSIHEGHYSGSSMSSTFNPWRAISHPHSSFHPQKTIWHSTTCSFHPQQAISHPMNNSFHLWRANLDGMQ